MGKELNERKVMKKFIYFFIFFSFFLSIPAVWAGSYTFEGQVLFHIDQASFTEIYAGNNGTIVGLPGAKLKFYDKDIITRNLLAEAETNEDGWYNVKFSYSGPWTDPNPDIKVVITLNNNRTSTHNLYGKIFTWKSDKMPNLPPDYYNIGFELSSDGNYGQSANLHAALTWGLNHAFDIIGLTEHQEINTLFPNPFSDHSFNFGTNFIHKNNLTSDWNGVSLILHEASHGLAFYQPNFGLTIDIFASPYGGDGEHDWESVELADTAFYEAWADFMAYKLREGLKTDPYRRLTGSAEDIHKEVEVRDYNEMGEENEGNICTALWDLTDDEDDEQIRFISATQNNPITDITPWSRTTNIVEVYGLEAANSSYYFLHAKGSGRVGKVGIWAVPKSRTITNKATYLFGESERENILTVTDNALYLVDSRGYNLYRYPMTSLGTMQSLLGTDSSFMHQYSVFGLSSSYPRVAMSYDSEHQAVYVYTQSSYDTSTTLKIDDTTLAITNLGKSPFTSDNLCLMFYNDRCYYLGLTSTNEDLEYYSNTIIEYDPATDTSVDLFPNSDPIDNNGPFSFGSFDNVSIVVDENNVIAPPPFNYAPNYSFRGLREVFGSGARLYFGAETFNDYNIIELDLNTLTFMRQAGSSESGTTNAANLLSTFEDRTEIVGDTDGIYYYAFVRGSSGAGITALRRIELDPVGEYIEMYCGNDAIELDVTDIYDSLDRSLDTMMAFDGMLATTFGGGNHSDLLVNNWVQLNLCQTPGTYETAAKSTSATSSMDETVPSDSTTWSIHDLTDGTTYAPATIIATGTDSDGDGVPDFADAFPSDATEKSDFDEDGIGDNADTDDDGDGTPDSSDAFPYDPTETADTDGDGVGNNSDPT